MKAQFRIFTSDIPQIGQELLLSPEASLKIAKVLRLKKGDILELVNGDGKNYEAELLELNPKKSLALIKNATDNTNPNALNLHLYLAFLKGEALENVLKKAVELGAKKISLVETQRSERKINEDKFLRLENILISAMLQCGRSEYPQLLPPLKSLAEAKAEAEINWIFSPHDSEVKTNFQSPKSVAVFIGAEGGFSPEEIKIALENGWKIKNFGKEILRADTAAIAAMVMAQIYFAW